MGLDINLMNFLEWKFEEHKAAVTTAITLYVSTTEDESIREISFTIPLDISRDEQIVIGDFTIKVVPKSLTINKEKIVRQAEGQLRCSTRVECEHAWKTIADNTESADRRQAR